MENYVVGFAFARGDSELYNDTVLLIQKEHPAWQAGRLNGIGGKIEPGETNWRAMVREFKEEAGLYTYESDWAHFATIVGPEQFSVSCFSAAIPWGILRQARSVTPEKVVITSMYAVNWRNAIPNLTWLLPMARNLHHGVSPRKAIRLEIKEHYENS